MNWIRENKFLTGFIAVMVIGSGVLGYLLYTAWGNYSDISDQYASQASALHQLEVRVPYPNAENLAKYKGEERDYIAATQDLAANLSRMTLPVEDLTPSAFQDRLRDTVATVLANAAKANVKLPDHFYLDFDKYQTSPPTAEAAGPLARQLAAIKLAMDIVIAEHVDEITSIARTPLPQEGGAESAAGGGRAFGGGAGGGGGRFGQGGGGSRLVEKFPFDLKFTSSQPVFQKVLNDFAASDKQFFITRTLLVENTDPKPVAKDAGTAAATPAASPATTGTDSSAAGSAGYLSFIVGTEKLNVAMRIDITAFNPPEKTARAGAASPR